MNTKIRDRFNALVGKTVWVEFADAAGFLGTLESLPDQDRKTIGGDYCFRWRTNTRIGFEAANVVEIRESDQPTIVVSEMGSNRSQVSSEP